MLCMANGHMLCCIFMYLIIYYGGFAMPIDVYVSQCFRPKTRYFYYDFARVSSFFLIFFNFQTICAI